MQKNYKYFWRILVVVLVNVLVIAIVTNWGGSVQTLSKVGSQGSEVKQIQTKLRDMGYYSGSIDSVFGTQTRNALVRFQRAKGLTPDGIAGSRTLSALGIGGTTTTSGGLGKFSSKDISLLAQVVSAEARGEPFNGQVAVAAVILNRIQHPSFPNTLAGVVYQPGAFSCMTDGGIYHNVSDSAYKAARDAINGWDPSGGSIYYYNPAKSTSKWIFARPVVTVIGKHRFCK